MSSFNLHPFVCSWHNDDLTFYVLLVEIADRKLLGFEPIKLNRSDSCLVDRLT